MKVSQNDVIYVLANFKIFMRSLTIFPELFLFLCRWKRGNKIWKSIFQFCYRAKPVNPAHHPLSHPTREPALTFPNPPRPALCTAEDHCQPRPDSARRAHQFAAALVALSMHPLAPSRQSRVGPACRCRHCSFWLATAPDALNSWPPPLSPCPCVPWRQAAVHALVLPAAAAIAPPSWPPHPASRTHPPAQTVASG
jgi:hypothetical protein